MPFHKDRSSTPMVEGKHEGGMALRRQCTALRGVDGKTNSIQYSSLPQIIRIIAKRAERKRIQAATTAARVYQHPRGLRHPLTLFTFQRPRHVRPRHNDQKRRPLTGHAHANSDLDSIDIWKVYANLEEMNKNPSGLPTITPEPQCWP